MNCEDPLADGEQPDEIREVRTKGSQAIVVDEEVVRAGMWEAGDGQGGLRIAHLNVNCYNHTKDVHIVERMRIWRIDILILMDCRMNAVESGRARTRIEGIMEEIMDSEGGRVLESPHEEGDTSTQRVGGMLVLVAPGLRKVYIDLRKCAMKMGLNIRLRVTTEDGEVTVVGTYWPTRGGGENSVWEKVKRWMKANGKRGCPGEWVKEITARMVTVGQRGGGGVVVVGDLNSEWSGAGGSCRVWAERNGVEDLTDGSGRTTRGKGKRIDHALGCRVGVYRWGMDKSDLAREVSDHSTMWVEVGASVSRMAAERGRGHRRSLGPRTEVEWGKYCDEVLRTEREDMTVDEIMENYWRAAVKVGGSGGSKGQYDGWSPGMLAIKAHMNFLRRVRYGLVGKGPRKWGTVEEVRREVDKEASRLQAVVSKLRMDEEEWEWVSKYVEPAIDWRLRDPMRINLQMVIQKEATAAKGLQGRIRKEMRKRISVAVRKREEALEEGKLKKVIDSMIGRYKEPLSWKAVKVDGKMVVGERQTLEAYTKAMDEWHGPEEFPEAVDRLYWNDIFSNREAFMGRTGETGVPQDLREVIWAAIENSEMEGKKRQVKMELDRELDPGAPPSFEEYEAQVKRSSKGGKAAGPSGVTYDMLRMAPEECRKRLYGKLVGTWATLKYPESWSIRWLKLIPKGDGGGIEDVRPICLVEVLRKVWNSLILRRISRALERNGILAEEQCAFRPNRGTDTAMLQMINALEEAEEQGTEAYVSSWDTRRAFDSPAKQALMRAWTRLGVPPRIAQYLVNIDRGGISMVKSDLSQEMWEERGREGIGSREEDIPSFEAKRGTGQGDVTSPLNWDCLYDILLRALRIGGENDFRIRASDQRITSVGDLAYADDLVSIAAREDTLQRKADIVSAFMVVFQMTIVPKKLRLVWFDFRRERVRGDDEEKHVVVHRKGWIEERVAIRRMGRIKYLGCLFEGGDGGDAQFDETMKMVREQLGMVMKRKASAGAKAVVINMCVIARACYAAKFCSWGQDRMLRLEKEFSRAYRKVTRNMASFPTELIYMEKRDGGLGFPNFVDRVMASQWSMLVRAVRWQGGVRDAAEGLMERTLREKGGGTSWGRESYVEPDPASGMWMSTLVNHMDKRGVKLRRGGVKEPEELGMLEDPDVGIGVTRRQDREDTVELRVGQAWWDDTVGRVLELVGRNETNWECRIWLPREDPRETGRRSPRGELLPKGMELAMARSTSGVGGGTFSFLSHDETQWIHPEGKGLRVFLEPDKPGKGRYSDRLMTRVVETRECTVVADFSNGGEYMWYEEDIWKIQDIPDIMIFTDGSFRRDIGVRAGIEPDCDGSGAGAIVVMSKDWRSHPIYSWRFREEGRRYNSAFDIEIAMVSAATDLVRRLGRGTIHTDCEAVVKRTEKGGYSGAATKGHTEVSNHIRDARKKKCIEVKWVRSHPEEWMERKDWKEKDYGIFMADRVAGGQSCMEGRADVVREVKFQEAFRGIRDKAQWGWEEGGLPMQRSMAELSGEYRRKEYLRKRDGYRREAGRLPRWEGCTVRFAAGRWRKLAETKGIAEWARLARVFWDKSWDGRNEGKGKGDGSPLDCPMCGGKDGMQHWARECSHEDLTRVREEAERRVRGRSYGAKKGKVAGSRFCNVVDEIRRTVIDGEDEKVWCGYWTESQISVMEGMAGELVGGEQSAIGNLVKDIGDITTEAVLKMWATRERAIEWREEREKGGDPFGDWMEIQERNRQRRGPSRKERGKKTKVVKAANVSVKAKPGMKAGRTRPEPLPVVALVGKRKRRKAQRTMEDFFGAAKKRMKAEDHGRGEGKDEADSGAGADGVGFEETKESGEPGDSSSSSSSSSGGRSRAEDIWAGALVKDGGGGSSSGCGSRARPQGEVPGD
jgi:hypothetical protein